MKYLLDTNICIYIIKKKPEAVLKRFMKLKPESIGISSITVAEFYFGISKSTRPNENIIALEQFLLPLIQIDYTKTDAQVYGKIRAQLDREGKMIGAMDLLIASQAINRNLILVTNNEREFKRIDDLKVENWVD
ncbi:MAG: twitching motility protein PilT [Stygiobacter sp. RIFOXYC12_FULL_38_8]|nr:MAG: putative nucleic acid-binding protein contains PIN domain [Stygiobacter sp.]KAF0214672.1 MAG: putative nucleic acid-binding protein contains PIN [Ignavibacteria bacterium]OGU68515.1 MAG: twitching motility protein PilT [Stygiobacter sp. GWC2_38_9]OGV08085.1 MAG: twitching motility protein PilT [Stygiobacter sp. RIFOXYB2_FULL_37_11]OGV15601.1 MAG: twitching motility protein PilT [Stygiobacter sp. RIFOXYC2_FULL_38_25]OGV16435.1 MAG: twitching motility protein PilT [Stygiobacter sp. RIFOX